MRKRVLGSFPSPPRAQEEFQWLRLPDVAEVEVTSEAEGYPVESAFTFGAGPGWRAGSPGVQRIRLFFDKPQSIEHMRLQFQEPDDVRAQEFSVKWAGGSDQPF